MWVGMLFCFQIIVYVVGVLGSGQVNVAVVIVIIFHDFSNFRRNSMKKEEADTKK